jgi:hypothetical protein
MTRYTVTTTSRAGKTGVCPLCRHFLPLTFHHLSPKKLHRRPRYRRRYHRSELVRGIYICRECHDGIHSAYPEAELATRLSTPEALASDPRLSRHFTWLSRQRRGETP